MLWEDKPVLGVNKLSVSVIRTKRSRARAAAIAEVTPGLWKGCAVSPSWCWAEFLGVSISLTSEHWAQPGAATLNPGVLRAQNHAGLQSRCFNGICWTKSTMRSCGAVWWPHVQPLFWEAGEEGEQHWSTEQELVLLGALPGHNRTGVYS